MSEIMDKLGIDSSTWKSIARSEFERIVWVGDPKCTKEQWETAKAEVQAGYPLKELRKERDQLLVASDWTGLSDSALTSEVSAKWKLYRQKLRDLPKGLTTEFKVKNVKWPTSP